MGVSKRRRAALVLLVGGGTFRVFLATRNLLVQPLANAISDAKKNHVRLVNSTVSRNAVAADGPSPKQSVAGSDATKKKKSSVVEIGPGVDLFFNVCILPLNNKKGKVLGLHGFLDDGPLLVPYDGGLPQFSKVLPLETSSPGFDQLVWIQDPTLLIVTGTNGNPAHCLNDVAVSIAMNKIEASSSSSDVGTPSWEWPTSFVNIYEWRYFLPFSNTTAGEWCYDVLQASGLVPSIYNPIAEATQLKQRELQELHQHAQTEVPETGLRSQHIQAMGSCFEQLFLPRYAIYRKLPTREAAQGLLYIQRQLVKTYNLSLEPIPVSDTNNIDNDTSHTPPRVLLYDRTDAQRRTLQNATEIKHLLESNYHVRVDLIQGQQWKNMTTAHQQLRLYNKYSGIVAPHGAHLSNLLAARPGTRVVEILCSVRWNDQPNNTIMNQNGGDFDKDAWYNINGTVKLQQWFARNGQILGLEVFHYREKEGCRKTEGRRAYGGTPPPRISVDQELFVQFVANRLLLEPKNQR